LKGCVKLLVCSHAHSKKHARTAEFGNGLSKAAKAPRSRLPSLVQNRQVRKGVFQDHDLYVILGETRRQQRGVFDDRIILAVAATGSKSLEWSTPMVGNAPSCVVTCRPNREINRSVDQANSGAAAFACTL
jgi:hypothetical protein